FRIDRLSIDRLARRRARSRRGVVGRSHGRLINNRSVVVNRGIAGHRLLVDALVIIAVGHRVGHDLRNNPPGETVVAVLASTRAIPWAHAATATAAGARAAASPATAGTTSPRAASSRARPTPGSRSPRASATAAGSRAPSAHAATGHDLVEVALGLDAG